MKFGIIAAGLGSRLTKEGVGVAKPMLEISGEMMIDRLIRIFTEAGAEEIAVITREEYHPLLSHLRSRYDALDGYLPGKSHCNVPLQLIVKDTPGSMYSFYEVSKCFRGASFCVTTVDTVFSEKEFEAYISEFGHTKADGLFGVTPYIDDEKPLFVEISEDSQISGFYDDRGDRDHVSAGIYGFRTDPIPVLEECIRRGKVRMRDFQRSLIASGQRIDAFEFAKVIDVDHISDIAKAEQLIHEK